MTDQKPTELSFFQKRIVKELDLNLDLNKIVVHNPLAEYPTPARFPIKIFEEDKDGNIIINVWRLNRHLIPIENVGSGKMSAINPRKTTYFSITRLKNPVGDNKYLMPKGQGTYPFFPPNLTAKFELKEEIKTLILTEGYFKAFRADAVGLNCVGLSSITHYKHDDKLYHDIGLLIKECKVQELIILWDGDCLDFSDKALEDYSEWDKRPDITRRPKLFYGSVRNIAELLKPYEINTYFAHIKSETFRSYPKGLDDLINTAIKENRLDEVIKDLLNDVKPHYFYKKNISAGLGKLYQYFHLHDPEQFYMYHGEKIGEKVFNFNGSLYKYDEVKAKLEIQIPAEARSYIRVGTDYYKLAPRYRDNGRKYWRRLNWSKQTIVDDHGKFILKSIPKYDEFENSPNHFNYNRVINGCLNLYEPFPWEPEEGDCSNTLEFIKHIFGTDKKIIDGREIADYELGLEYLWSLIFQPTEKLPILCLVSKENKTGKSVFAEQYLGALLGDNAITIGNDELNSDFNAIYSTKRIIFCDEAMLQKKAMVEKWKRLATSPSIIMNEKNMKAVQVPFHGSLILSSNDIKRFLRVTPEDTRFWVIEVPKPKTTDKTLIKKLTKEIPAFLFYLGKRKPLFNDKTASRLWIPYEYRITAALSRLQGYSEPSLARAIRHGIVEMFLNFGQDVIMMPTKEIKQIWASPKIEDVYIKEILKDYMGLKRFMEKGKVIVKRHYYMAWEEVFQEGEIEYKEVRKNTIGRQWVFNRADFITSHSIKEELEDN